MDGIDVGQLIALATDPAVSPGRSGKGAEYARLVNRYITEAEFRRTVNDVLEGAGCVVTDVLPDVGLVLAVDAEASWCWQPRSIDLPWNKDPSPQDRAARMIVIPALLAYLAPTAADLEDRLTPGDLRQVSVRELDRFIREFAAHCEENQPEPAGPDKPVWWYWCQRSEDAGDTGRIRRKSTTYWVFDVLQFLNERGLLARTGPASGAATVYRPRRRLLAHYRDLLIDDLYTALLDFADTHPATADETESQPHGDTTNGNLDMTISATTHGDTTSNDTTSIGTTSSGTTARIHDATDDDPIDDGIRDD